ncbi:MAG: hypothetical protein LBT30_02445 [Clostridiales bacterium]|jgi:hypothetical protein|nr:hypothetical protein [Clostridiales bacterium]
MAPKNAKLYTALYKFFSADCNLKQVKPFFGELTTACGYETAADVFEFLLVLKEDKLKSFDYAKELCESALEVLLKANRIKTIALLKDNTAVSKRIFTLSGAALTGASFRLLGDLIYSSKFEEAEYFIGLFLKNTAREKIDDDIENLFDDLFVRYKTTAGKVVLPKRNAAFLISTAERIKGPKSALLIQKVKVLI